MTSSRGRGRCWRLHARELPQRDDLCGAFCGALALGAGGVERRAGEPLDQDAVGLAAGSIVARLQDPRNLPRGERGRRDYRLELPFVEDAAVSGTTVAGVLDAIERLSGGALAAIPYPSPASWTITRMTPSPSPASQTITRMTPSPRGPLDGGDARRGVRARGRAERPVTLIANIATHHLWGGHRARSRCSTTSTTGRARRPARGLGRGALRLRVRARAGPRGQPLRGRRHLPGARGPRGARAARGASRRGDRAAGGPGRGA